jgi:hypothetical protein
VGIEWERASSGNGHRVGNYVIVSWFSKVQNIPELKVGYTKFFNFSSKTYKLPNSISGDNGDSPDSNYTKYVNYKGLDLKKMGVIFPFLRDA